MSLEFDVSFFPFCLLVFVAEGTVLPSLFFDVVVSPSYKSKPTLGWFFPFLLALLLVVEPAFLSLTEDSMDKSTCSASSSEPSSLLFKGVYTSSDEAPSCSSEETSYTWASSLVLVAFDDEAVPVVFVLAVGFLADVLLIALKKN